MARQVKNLSLLVVILAFTSISFTNATVTKTSNFAKLNAVNERLRVLRAVWGELRLNSTENVEQVKNFYDNILKYTEIATNAAEIEEAAEFTAEVRQVLVTINGHLLAETLNHNDSQKLNAVKDYRTQLLSKYSFELTNAIFEQAIDEVYAFKSTDLLHAQLNAIDLYPTTAITYRLRVNWNLYLYHKFLQRGDINDKYLYETALALRNLKYAPLYNSLPKDSARRIDAAFKTFPSSLNVLFNSTAVCLENVNMPNFYLYFAESSASTASTYVPAIVRNRFESKSNDRLVWRNSFADRSISAPTALNLRLKSNLFYLYRQAGNNPLLIQRSDNSAIMRNWTPTLVDEHIMFEGQGYYMCATQQFDASLMGFSVKSLNGFKMEDTNCHWILTDCSNLCA